MASISKKVVVRLAAKAEQSTCKFRVAAIGLNHNGDIVAVGVNKPFRQTKGGGIHAEMEVMRYARRRGVVKIIIGRIGRGGAFRPIDPCENCAAYAKKLGIKIESVG
jgi:deoxycytidylate deaminase